MAYLSGIVQSVKWKNYIMKWSTKYPAQINTLCGTLFIIIIIIISEYTKV